MAKFILRPAPQHALLDLHELWRYRYLFLVLVWRNLKIRYQQTAVGVAWAVLQPLLLTAVFTLVFSRLASMPTDGQPYPIFVLGGLLMWQFVAQSFQQASASVVFESYLVTRIYFPRILLLLATIGAALFDLACVFGLMVCFMLWYRVAPGIGALAFVPALLLATATVFGLSLWLSALYVRYRDVGLLLPFITLIWMYLSPVIYPLSLLPPKYEALYAMNPIVVAVQTSRWAFAGGTPPNVGMVGISTAVAAVLVVTGLWFFRRQEGTFADIV
ncbi:MAG TPA: ABC transporter permease [Burkholderiales bacterium]